MKNAFWAGVATALGVMLLLILSGTPNPLGWLPSWNIWPSL